MPRGDFREVLRKASRDSDFVTESEGLAMEKNLFPSDKYGDSISASDIDKRLGELKSDRFQAEGSENRLKIERKIKLLEKLRKQ